MLLHIVQPSEKKKYQTVRLKWTCVMEIEATFYMQLFFVYVIVYA